MPQAGAELTKRILGRYKDHGTAQACCHTLVERHGKINQGFITMPVEGDADFDSLPDQAWDAAQYLIEEWDYAYGPGPKRRAPPTPVSEELHRLLDEMDD